MTTFATPRRDELPVVAVGLAAVPRASRFDGIGAAVLGSAAVHCFALISLAMLLILVLLPAVLGAAGIQAVVAV